MSEAEWLPFAPPALGDIPPGVLLDLGRRLEAIPDYGSNGEKHDAVERCRAWAAREGGGSERGTRQQLLAAVYVLADLAKQGWGVRVGGGAIEVSRPETDPEDDEDDRKLVRRQLHAERDEQLRQPAVRAFIREMETRQLFGERFTSVFSLMRDGSDLAAALRQIRALPEEGQLERLGTVIRPYLQFPREGERCPHTGLRLLDVWRYFRHTWANPLKSVPGRTMTVLVRDAATSHHPVIGIAALSSAAVAVAARDERIGWTPECVLTRMEQEPSVALARWLRKTVDEALSEIYTPDLLRDGLLTLAALRNPPTEVVAALEAEADAKRKIHYRLMEAKEYKRMPPAEEVTAEGWRAQAESPLFRSKRCDEIAQLLRVRATLLRFFGERPTKAGLQSLVADRAGRDAVSRVVRRAKAERVGTAIADLTVCGAVPPYNELLGGKLVAMLMTSPEVVLEYRRRYGGIPSVIASSMAGRPTVRAADLAFLGTTSLYDQRPTQYDRISVPCDPDDPRAGAVRYEYLGRTKGVGTFQFGPRTVAELSRLLTQSRRGQRVNSVFGEGVNPRLRKVRDGLDLLGLSSDELLNHGGPRLVYGVELAANAGPYLLGMVRRPQYVLPMKQPSAVTEQIIRWWAGRWLLPRLGREETCERIARHTLVYPVRHGARVQLPSADPEQGELFGDLDRL